MSSRFFPSSIPGNLRLGLGGAALGNLFQPVPDAQVQALMAAAWASGCRSFDTAPHYGNGLSERRMGDALRAHASEPYLLSSQAGRLLTALAKLAAEDAALLADNLSEEDYAAFLELAQP